MRGRSRRVLAVLAGGVVLIGGGVTTLASWIDDEYAKAPLALSSFNLEQSVDGNTWTDADDVTKPSSLSLTVQSVKANPMSPDGIVVGWLGLRAAQRSLGATVTMDNLAVGADAAGVGAYLTYEAVARVSRDDCRAGTTPSSAVTLVPAGTAMSSGVPSTTQFTVNPGTDAAAGEAVGVCMRVKLAVGAPRRLGGASVDPVWRFHATSRE